VGPLHNTRGDAEGVSSNGGLPGRTQPSPHQQVDAIEPGGLCVGVHTELGARRVLDDRRIGARENGASLRTSDSNTDQWTQWALNGAQGRAGTLAAYNIEEVVKVALRVWREESCCEYSIGVCTH
jgi:hypothetical protein